MTAKKQAFRCRYTHPHSRRHTVEAYSATEAALRFVVDRLAKDDYGDLIDEVEVTDESGATVTRIVECRQE